MKILALMCVAFFQDGLLFPPTGEFAVEPVSSCEPEADSDFYVARFTASYCVPCHTYDTSGKWEVVKRRYPSSVVVDVEQTKTWNNEVQRVPCFWLIRKSDGRAVKKWTAGDTVDINAIEQEVKRHTTKTRTVEVTPDGGKSVVILKTTETPNRFSFSTKSSTTAPISVRSQAEIDAENHLRNTHGITVSGLSLAEMEAIHDKAHGGSGYHFPGRASLPILRSSSGNCPTGNCPTTNSSFLFWRRR